MGVGSITIYCFSFSDMHSVFTGIPLTLVSDHGSETGIMKRFQELLRCASIYAFQFYTY